MWLKLFLMMVNDDIDDVDDDVIYVNDDHLYVLN